MSVVTPKLMEQVHYDNWNTSSQLSRFELRPLDPRHHLAVVEMTLINPWGRDRLVLVIDERAAELVAASGEVYSPLDSVEGNVPLTGGLEPRYTVPEFIPLWTTVVLEPGHLIRGMLVFEVPPGSKFSKFRWLTGRELEADY